MAVIRLFALLVLMCFSFGLNAQAVRDAALLELKLDDDYRPFLHQQRANQVLAGWSLMSMGAGTAQLFSRNPYIRAFGMQNLIWGAVDGGIAWYGHHRLNKLQPSAVNLYLERTQFRKILLVNTLLDLGYLAAGYALSRSANPRWHGHGAGIMLQGGFLLLFDGVNYALTF
ncbi:MAG: DUF6992 family protein [Bacteroidia bacterium]